MFHQFERHSDSVVYKQELALHPSHEAECTTPNESLEEAQLAEACHSNTFQQLIQSMHSVDRGNKKHFMRTSKYVHTLYLASSRLVTPLPVGALTWSLCHPHQACGSNGDNDDGLVSSSG